jgi:uncharacterized protein YuzE
MGIARPAFDQDGSEIVGKVDDSQSACREYRRQSEAHRVSGPGEGLSERPSAESREVSEGVVLDYDADGCLVGIDIDNASTKIELDKLILSRLPGKLETAAA